MNKVSAYIVSYNREAIIEACIKSLGFADEIILIDKSSNDSTVQIAESYIEKIYVVPWSPTVEDTRVFAESLCSHDWIVFLDDDEVLNSNGARFILDELTNPKAHIYRFPRNEYILSRHSKSAYYYPNNQIRMYKRGSIEFCKSVHNGFRILTDSVFDIPLSYGVSIDHFSHKSIHEWIEKTNRYTSQSDRMRFYDPIDAKPYQETVRSMLFKWLKSEDDTASYENIVGTLRGIYDVIDYCKDWELANIKNNDFLNAIEDAINKLNSSDSLQVNRHKSTKVHNLRIVNSEESLLISENQNAKYSHDNELFQEYLRIAHDNSVMHKKYEQLSQRLNLIELSRSYKLAHILPIAKSEAIKLLKKLVTNHRIFLRKIYFSKFIPSSIRRRVTSVLRDNNSTLASSISDLNVSNFPNLKECNFYVKYMRFPRFHEINVSIIIPAYGKLPVLLNCLKSIYINPPKCSYEIIVIEDASGDRDIQRLSEIDGIKYIENQVNLGFTMNCNKAAGIARGKYLYFLNDDTQIKFDSIDALLRVSEDNTVGLVGSKLVYPSNVLQEAGGIVWKDGSAWNFGRGQNPDDLEFNYQRDVDYCSGASLLIKKSVFEQIGKFDEIYAPAYCEDTDLAYKVRSIGLRVVYEPKSVVVHYEGMSHGTDLNTGIKSYQVENQKKFFNKWRAEIESNFDNGTSISRAIHNDKNKKFILIVDNNTPFYERDAGSKTIIELCKIFKSCGYVVHFLPLNGYIGKDAHRLQSDGVYVIKSTNPSKYIAHHIDLYEKFFLSRPESSYLVLKLCDIPKSKIVYYGHDVHFERFKLKKELININDGIDSMEYKEKHIWRSCGLILYPSTDEVQIVKQYLEYKKIDATVKELPVFASRMLDRNKLPKYGDRCDLFFVGSSHHPNKDAINFMISDVLTHVSESLKNVYLHIAGSICDEISDHPLIKKHGIVSDTELERLYFSSRVFVAPLRYGMGVKGKIIEAFDLGCPVVTTDIGIQGLPNSAAVTAGSALDIATAIIDLYSSEKQWNAIQKVAIDFVQKNFTKGKILNALGLQ